MVYGLQRPMIKLFYLNFMFCPEPSNDIEEKHEKKKKDKKRADSGN